MTEFQARDEDIRASMDEIKALKKSLAEASVDSRTAEVRRWACKQAGHLIFLYRSRQPEFTCERLCSGLRMRAMPWRAHSRACGAWDRCTTQ